ncbi:hypothetical protein PVK06_038933 [Gossypium arboreum]|uniref:Uncharacterized protein n=1 Tax=Gossypium arboreum TaxID=29729 RepID=A0ABR0N3G3_GOSAR|nr:hypothetical protein PVK06_038933 [Gossypium arboreum]
MLPKIKVFCWRIGHDILPTYENIARIRPNFSSKCPRCKSEVETWIHTMKDCPKGTSRDPPKPMCKCWTKPPCGFVKVNVDAAISEGSIGYGVIARDTDSFVFGGSYGVINKTLDIIWAELEALSAGLKFEEAMNFSKIIVESDNALLINTVNKHEDDVTILGCCVNKECRLLNNFVSVRFKWIDRNSNAIADLLSRLAISNNCTLNFKLDYPLGIYNVIIRDAMN